MQGGEMYFTGRKNHKLNFERNAYLLLATIIPLLGILIFMDSLHQGPKYTVYAQNKNFQNTNSNNQVVQSNVDDPWAIERVDSELSAYVTDLVLDSSNLPHIVYGGDQLYYARYDGAIWYKELIDSSWGSGREASLALDSNDKPHIAYTNSISENLKYAHYDGDQLIVTTIDMSSGHSQTSIALGSNDEPYISYKANYELRLAQMNGSKWITQTIDLASAYYSSLALDNDNKPHVAYANGYSLKYAWLDNTEWMSTTINSHTEWNLYPSLAIDSQGTPHISYHDANPTSDLIYTWISDTTWISITVDSNLGRNSVSTYLCLDSFDNPHISYNDHDLNLKYAHQENGSWIISALDNGSETAIDVDNLNLPHLSYINLDSDIAYAKYDGSDWSLEIVDAGGNTDWTTSLALDSDYSPHIAYYWSRELRYATLNNGTWEKTSLDNSGGLMPSLVLDSNDYPYITHSDWKYGGLKYTWLTESGWVSSTIENGFVQSSSLVLGDQDIPHVAYGAFPFLKYAVLSDTHWISESIDTARNWAGGWVSLKLDSSDIPHISYTADDELRYATQVNDSWITYTLETGPVYVTDIELDQSGSPHIGYVNSNKLKYAWISGTTWISTTIDDYYGFYPSMALDSKDQPHFSYHGGLGWLKYAKLENSQWISVTVDNFGDAGRYTSLALDNHDNPFISYSGWTDWDIKFAWQQLLEVIPPEGGLFTANGIATLDFPAGSFKDTVVMTYTVSQPTTSQPNLGVFFDISAVYSNTQQTASLASGATYSLTVKYDKAYIPLGVREEDLGIYFYNGSEWEKEPTSVVNTDLNTITATPNHFSEWGILADIKIFIPLIFKMD